MCNEKPAGKLNRDIYKTCFYKQTLIFSLYHVPSYNSLLHTHALHFPLPTLSVHSPYVIPLPLLVTEISLSSMHLSLAVILQYLYCARSIFLPHIFTKLESSTLWCPSILTFLIMYPILSTVNGFHIRINCLICYGNLGHKTRKKTESYFS